MDYRIKKLANGGGFVSFTPFIEIPSQEQGNNTTATSGAAEKKPASSILDDDTFKELMTKGGLVNDVNNLVGELAKLEASDTNPFLSGANRSIALKMIGKVNELRQNKDLWNDAVKASSASGGLSEVAVGTSGEVYTKDREGKIKAISLGDYSKKRGEIQLLTVSELLNERQYNPFLTGQNAVFNVANNAIGINKITDHIKDLVKALGVESSESSQFYSKDQAKTYLQDLGVKAPTEAEKEAITTLRSIIETPGEYAQIESSSSSQRNHIDKALNYIWDTLGEPARQKLTVTAVMNGENPQKLLLDMLETQTSHSTKSTITPKELPGNTSADKTARNISLSPQELFHNDKLYQPGMKYEINNPGVSLKTTATGIGPLYSLQKAGEVLEPGLLSSIFTTGNYKAIVDPSKAYIGDSKIDPALMKEVAYTGEEVAKVYLPVKSDGTPDLGQMEQFNKAYEVFNINKDTWTVDQIQDYFRKAGFPGVQIKQIQSSDGTLTKVIGETGNVKPFLALPIITNSASNVSDNPWMLEMVGDEKDLAKMLMTEAFSVQGGTPSKPKITNTMPTGYFSLETPYKGTMFVAYRPESSAIITSMSGHLSGKAPTETDVYRNLNFSKAQNNPMGLNSSAGVLKNKNIIWKY